MDIVKGPWREERQTTAHPSSNVVIFSDGGARTNFSARTWVVSVLVDADGVQKLVPMVDAGLYFQEPISSFAAEAIALEQAMLKLRQWLRR